MALKFKQKALLATPIPASWVSSVIIHNVYIEFYTDVIGLEPKYIGWVYLIFNVWNVLNDPIFGVMLDKMPYRPGKGKYLGMVGALLVEDERGRRFALGSGLRDADRANPPAIGSLVTFRHDGLTAKGTPRFARYLRVRTDH